MLHRDLRTSVPFEHLFHDKASGFAGVAVDLSS